VRARPYGNRPALRRGALTPYLFLAPGLALFAAFRVYPLLDGLRLSFTNARLGRAQYAFVGLANYERLLEDTRFHVSLVNTAFYSVASTLPILAIPLLLAVALNRPDYDTTRPEMVIQERIGHLAAIRRESEGRHFLSRAGKDTSRGAILRLPEANGLIFASRCEYGPIRVEGYCGHWFLMLA